MKANFVEGGNNNSRAGVEVRLLVAIISLVRFLVMEKRDAATYDSLLGLTMALRGADAGANELSNNDMASSNFLLVIRSTVVIASMLILSRSIRVT